MNKPSLSQSGMSELAAQGMMPKESMLK